MMKFVLRFSLATVCAVAVLLAASFPAQSFQTEPADLVLTNGRIWTGGDSNSVVESAAIRGNQIVRVGATVEIKSLIGAKTQVIDLAGRLASPGFNDAHIHFLGGSMGLNPVALTRA